jgi:hypothetical protein
MTETAVADSYIATEEEALAYFAGDPRATAFVALDNIAWYLQRATFVIDSLKLRGRKYYRDGTQVWPNGRSKAFPREYRDGYDMDEATGDEVVPQHVLDACCEEALSIYLHLQDPMAQEVEKMQRRGATSASIGGEGSEAWQAGARSIRGGLRSEEAYALLSQHIARSFSII